MLAYCQLNYCITAGWWEEPSLSPEVLKKNSVPKDWDPKDSKSGLIYSYQCPQLDCDDEYMGETARTLGKRRKEHLKEPSPIHRHSQATGHPIDNNKFNIIGRENQGRARTIKESIYIRVNNPTLNQNIGKYNLNHI